MNPVDSVKFRYFRKYSGALNGSVLLTPGITWLQQLLRTVSHTGVLLLRRQLALWMRNVSTLAIIISQVALNSQVGVALPSLWTRAAVTQKLLFRNERF